MTPESIVGFSVVLSTITIVDVTSAKRAIWYLDIDVNSEAIIGHPIV